MTNETTSVEITMPMRVNYDGYLSFVPDLKGASKSNARCLMERWYEIAWIAQAMFNMKMLSPEDWHITIASRKEMEDWGEIGWVNKTYDVKFFYELTDVRNQLHEREVPGCSNRFRFEFAPSNFMVMNTKGKRSFGISLDGNEDLEDLFQEFRHRLPIKSPHLTLCNDTGKMKDSVGWTSYTQMDVNQIAWTGIPGLPPEFNPNREKSLHHLHQDWLFSQGKDLTRYDRTPSYEELECFGINTRD